MNAKPVYRTRPRSHHRSCRCDRCHIAPATTDQKAIAWFWVSLPLLGVIAWVCTELGGLPASAWRGMGILTGIFVIIAIACIYARSEGNGKLYLPPVQGHLPVRGQEVGQRHPDLASTVLRPGDAGRDR